MLFMAEAKAGMVALIGFVRLGLLAVEAFAAAQGKIKIGAEHPRPEQDGKQVLPDISDDLVSLHVGRVWAFNRFQGQNR